MSTAAPEPKGNMGQPVPRYDAYAKVTGKAAYAADMPLSRPAFAYLVTSAIAKGRIDGFDLAAAKRVRGLIDIVTYENADKLKQAKLFSNGGYVSTTIQPLKSPEIAHDGEIVAVVVAETFEALRTLGHGESSGHHRADIARFRGLSEPSARQPASRHASPRRCPSVGTTSGFLRRTGFVGSMEKREQRRSRMHIRTGRAAVA